MIKLVDFFLRYFLRIAYFSLIWCYSCSFFLYQCKNFIFSLFVCLNLCLLSAVVNIIYFLLVSISLFLFYCLLGTFINDVTLLGGWPICYIYVKKGKRGYKSRVFFFKWGMGEGFGEGWPFLNFSKTQCMMIHISNNYQEPNNLWRKFTLKYVSETQAVTNSISQVFFSF